MRLDCRAAIVSPTTHEDISHSYSVEAEKSVPHLCTPKADGASGVTGYEKALRRWWVDGFLWGRKWL
jgi:hypothetical protein